MASKVDTGIPLIRGMDHDHGTAQAHKDCRRARRPLSLEVLGDSVLDLIIAVSSAYFIIFAALVYTRRNQALDQPGNQALLEAAKYNPTIFPIVFSAIVAKFLKTIAAIKLENGASVLSLEYLLSSRTVFSAITAPITLRTISLLTPFLVILWALSPLGGQASLRVIFTQESLTNKTQNFIYLAFVSPFTNEGVLSASAEPLIPINALFTAAIIGSAKTKSLPQDEFGNVKIPVYESLPIPSLDDNSDWRLVPDSDDFQWSALTGLPVHGLPSSGLSQFTMSTGYMKTACNVSGHDWTPATSQSLEQFPGWSGANYAFTLILQDEFAPMSFTFRSLDIFGDDFDTVGPSGKILTIANCTTTMHYVDVKIRCIDQTCRSIAARPSQQPATHDDFRFTNLNATYLTPINGLGQNVSTMYMEFFPDSTNATNPTVGCDTVFCPPAAIEAYLADPENPLSQSRTTKLWKLGDELLSLRLSQLINTYWIDSIAPFAVSGNFNLSYDDAVLTQQYNKDSTIGTITTSQMVVKCDYRWLAIMLICSLVLFTAGLATVVLSACRRGPDILDRFSSLVRDNPYVTIPRHSSMEDAVDQSRRLRDAIVRLGDVQPEEDIGYIAIGSSDGSQAVQKLGGRRMYA